MIIACEKCQTRFKVGDEKFANGPIRVRCSKCNHVFQAAGPAASQPPIEAAPAPKSITGIFSMPPHLATTAPPPQQTGGFGSPNNRSGLFRAPTSSMPVTAVQPSTSELPSTALNPLNQPPSASLPPTMLTQQPSSSALPPTEIHARPGFAPPLARTMSPAASNAPSPFGAPPPFPASTFPSSPSPFPSSGFPSPTPPPSPFAPSAASAPSPSGFPGGRPAPPGFGAPPRSPSSTSLPPVDPFGGLGARGHTPNPQDPFAPRAADPFGGASSSSAPDPFAGLPSKPPAQALTPNPADPFARAGGDPFGGGSSSPPSASPFQLTPGPDPFGASSSPARPDPFGGMSAASPSPAVAANAQADALPDPFGISGAPSPAHGAIDDAPPRPPPSPPDDDSGDPFGGLDIDAADANALFDAPAPAAPAQPPSASSPPPSSAGSSAPRNVVTAPLPAPVTGPGMEKLRRLETAQRVKDVLWAALQLLLFAAFVVVAVVIARGGRLDDLMRGDLRAALGGAHTGEGLVVEDAHVARRTLPSGIDVVVVTGVVVNKSAAAVPAARVDVRFGDAWSSGWAWSTIDGIDVDTVRDAPDTHPLSMRGPRSPVVQPGDRAPFVVVAPAPQEGMKAAFVVTAAVPASKP